jgi:hypothetical protein
MIGPSPIGIKLDEHYNKVASSTKVKLSLRCSQSSFWEVRDYCSVLYVSLFGWTECGTVCWCVYT